MTLLASSSSLMLLPPETDSAGPLRPVGVSVTPQVTFTTQVPSAQGMVLGSRSPRIRSPRVQALRAGIAIAALGGCAASGPPNSGLAFSDDPGCDERKQHLIETLAALPDAPSTVPVAIALPTSTLGGSYGPGALLELEPGQARLNGVLVPDDKEALESWFSQALLDVEKAHKPVYIAASHNVDVQTLQGLVSKLPESLGVQLLFNTPPIPPSDAPPDVYDLAARVLTERDPASRATLTQQGYQAYSHCPGVEEVAARYQSLPAQQRWPKLKADMTVAIRGCGCEQLDTEGLAYLLVAEQRAGAVSLGSVPAGYLRDVRCSASMPLLSPARLLEEIEKFDAEFSGDWRSGALHFDTDVLTNERLLNYLCVALPGETLEHIARRGQALYWKPVVGEPCEQWIFEPQSRGAPMGTLQRQSASSLAVHYWLGAEEVRVFGPVTGSSRASEKPQTACSQNFNFKEVTQSSIGLKEGGRWYFDRSSCEAAPASEAAFKGCIADLTQGQLPLQADPPNDEAPPPSPAPPVSQP